MTFFYPSTEWDMAQGFDCNCGATVSLAGLLPASSSVSTGIQRGYREIPRQSSPFTVHLGRGPREFAQGEDTAIDLSMRN